MHHRTAKSNSITKKASQVVSCVLAVLFFAIACGNFPHQQRISLLFLGMAIGTAVAAYTASGWTIPGLVLGIMGGLTWDSGIKGGTRESQIQETEFRMVVAPTIGLLLGFAIDLAGRRRKPEAAEER